MYTCVSCLILIMCIVKLGLRISLLKRLPLLGDNRTVSSGSIIPQEEGYDETSPEPRMEESFTIYLGMYVH